MPTGHAPAAGPPPGEVVPAEDAGGPVIVFRGVVDRDAVRRFRRLVPPASWPARADLSAVTSIDAAGLELLVHLSRKPRRQGRDLALVGVPEALHPAMERAGLSGLLPRPGAAPTTA